MRNKRRKSRPENPNNSPIAELGLNPDLYDARGNPIEWIEPKTGALVGGDLEAFRKFDGVQMIGTFEQFASGAEPQLRPMTLDDVEDDCPVCQMNRERILAGDPPMVMAFDKSC
jgi:hypothetical protein